MNNIIINNSNVVINKTTEFFHFKKHFKKMWHIGKWRLYLTYDYRLKNSQHRDSDKNRDGFLALKKTYWEKHKGRCQCCGKQIGKKSHSQLHHILPYHKFPQYQKDERNLLLLCETCHRAIHRDPFLESRMITATAKELGVNLSDYYNV